MQIGFCENCRYIDLIENVKSVCPRCGGQLSSMGISSAEWNDLSVKERDGLIREKFPTHEDLFGPRPVIEETTDETQQTAEEEGVRNADEPWVIEETIRETSEEVPDKWDVEEVSEEEPEEIEDEVPQIVLQPITAPVAEETDREEETSEPDDTEYVYVCYKCNSIAGHDRSHEKYYCTDCGSDMVNVGYTVMQWSDLSKEEKRKVSENAKIVHMVSEIKRDNYEDSEADHTPSIIKVVKNPDSDYV